MLYIRWIIFVVLALCITAWGQSNNNEPHIGYLYPAGGRQGSVVIIMAGGQSLRGATDAYVSGEGVRASVIQYYRPMANLQKEQRILLEIRFKNIEEKRLAELSGKDSSRLSPSQEKNVIKNPDKSDTPTKVNISKSETGPKKENTVNVDEFKLSEHPLLYDLDNKSIRELAHIRNMIFAPRKRRQPNRQIAEYVLIEITIAPDAEPGDRELRIGTLTGLTNPMTFRVGLLPETRELEPNNRQAHPDLSAAFNLPKEKPLDVPVLLNGQIMPGDVDRFRFRARQGQQLAMQVQARSLIPYLADAVPGWFQAALTLYDSKGKEVAFVDDYRFNPDPVLFYKIPENGEYELEIRDSIYRGREDFVYRIAVSEQPFITQMFPLGGQEGVITTASIAGWNLPETQLTLDTHPGAGYIRKTAFHKGTQLSNSVAYAVDTLPECNETESNDTIEDAQQIELPRIINGRIERPGDVDVFRLQGRAGDNVVAEVYGRRLNSPLDSLLRLTDASGDVLKWNDDYVTEDNHLYTDILGLVTHHADSYLTAELPKDGIYYIHLADSQHHGGQAYSYRLRISAPQPDFTLRMTPSSLSTRAGGNIPICVYALRTDGFNGDIEMVLKDAPLGFRLNGTRIPAGRDRVRVTLMVPPDAPDQPVALHIEGHARIGGQTISCPAVPADDLMQAFLYRHLVPAKEMLVSIQKARWNMPQIELADSGPVLIPVGGSAQVKFKTGRRANFKDIQFQLSEPPNGLTLDGVTIVPEGLVLKLKADKDAIQSGFADNLIVEAFRESTPRQQEGKPVPQKRRVSVGFLPAIPIEIVQG